MSVLHINDHLSVFYDAHFLMAYLGANSRQHVDQFIESVKHYLRYIVVASCGGSSNFSNIF